MRSKTDDIVIAALGQERFRVAQAIDAFQPNTLSDLQSQLADLEAKLKSIDPTIPTLAEEKQAAQAQAAQDAAAAQTLEKLETSAPVKSPTSKA